jgi:nuclear pore complex protein Nup98-Nup96
MTRVPELHGRIQEEEENAVPDASEAMELAELVRQIPKLIGILPDVLRDRTDPRHSAALAVMISGLMLHLDRIQPLSLVSTLSQALR